MRATRSIEGGAAVLVAGTLAVVHAQIAAGMTWPERATVAVAAAGAVVKAVSPHRPDHLTVQLAVAATMALLAG